jgi:hypothetical protein
MYITLILQLCLINSLQHCNNKTYLNIDFIVYKTDIYNVHKVCNCVNAESVRAMSRRKYYKKVKEQTILENMDNMQLVKYYVNEFQIQKQKKSEKIEDDLIKKNTATINNPTILLDYYEVVTNKIEKNIKENTNVKENKTILFIDIFNVFVIILYLMFID